MFALILATGAGTARQAGSGAPVQQPPAQQPPSSQPPAGQEAQPQQPAQPTFRAGINFVRVDVIVTDRQGNPVTDLKASDFEVVEDGKPQTVESFKLVKIGSIEDLLAGAPTERPIRTQSDEETEAAREDVRLFVIFLDDYHVRRGASMRVRDPLIQFIQTQLAPSDLVALMYPLTPVGDVQFTRNHGGIVSAIQRFDGRKYDYTPRNMFEEKYAFYPASTVERIRNQVTLSALKALVTHLGGVREGRKAVILVSEGYSNSLPPQLRDPVASMPGLGNPNRGNPVAGENDQREETAQFFSSVDLVSDLREVYDAANRNNAAIYALDPRGLAAAEFDINEGVGFRMDSRILQATQDTLRTLAGETDGRAIVNMNDLTTGLKQIVRDSSVYYLLGYNSTQAPSDGKFHEIKVRVRRQGAQVRARKGYWALTVEETARATAPPKPGPPPAVAAALGSIAAPPRARPVRTWIGTARGEDGKTRVTFVWEPTPAVPGLQREQPVRAAVAASASDGTLLFRGRVPDVALASAARPGDSPAAPPPIAAASTARGPSRVTFDAPPGRMELRVAVESATGQVLDNDVDEITVPDLTAPQVALSTPVVLRARTARDLQALNTDPDAIPTAGRDFQRTDRLLVRFDAYGPGTTPPTATARLLNRTGQRMADLPVQPAKAGAQFQIDLPLSAIATGEYLIEIKASGESGDATELVAFRIVG